MSHAAPESGDTFTTTQKGAVSTAKVGRAPAVQVDGEPQTFAAAELATSSPTLPTPVRLAIYAIGTPIAAAAMFVAGSEVTSVVHIVAGAVGAAAVAAVGTTALGNLNR